MARNEVQYSGEFGEFVHVEETRQRTRLTAAQRRRQDNQIEDLIADESMTIRAAAAIFGVHNSTIYRRMAGRMGRRNHEVRTVWICNKAASLERANAARKMKRALEQTGGGG